MDWFYYALLGVLPAIAAFGGGIAIAIAKVCQEHIEDHQLLKNLFERLADESDPLTPEEFRQRMKDLKREYGESKEAWKKLWEEIRNITQKVK